jgi:hypothetical protein
MSLAALVGLVKQIFIAVLGNSALTQQVFTLLGIPAQEDTAQSILDQTGVIIGDTESTVYGLAAIKTAVDDLAATLAAVAVQVSSIETAVIPGVTVTTLPTVPPTGYGSTDISSLPHDIWLYNMPGRGYPIYNYLDAAGQWGAFSANLRWLGDENQYFAAVFTPHDFVPGADDWVPVFDPTDILIGEDILACLTRQNSGWTLAWSFAPGGYVRLNFPGTADIQEWQTTFDQAGFASIKALVWPPSLAPLGPIWPGVANVTLLTPVAITSALDITEPMNGVIVTLTGVPPDKPRYVIGDQTATAHIGQLAFLSDNGDMEYPQNLSFASELYVPTTMLLAAGVKLRAVPGVTGTVTPWVTP